MNKYDNVLLHLKILSQIPRNGRIRRTNNGSVTLETDGILVPVKRFIYRDDRKQAVVDINSIVSDAFGEIKSLLTSKYMVESDITTDEGRETISRLQLLYIELEKAYIGVHNLKTTYQSDIPITSQIDIVLNKIQSMLGEVKRKCPAAVPNENIPMALQ